MNHANRLALLTAIILIGLAVFTPAAEVQVFASPNGGCTAALVNAIDHAEKEILVATYSLTSEPIADALDRAHTRGVAVFLIVDRRQPNQASSQVRLLAKKKLPIKVDRVESLFHVKTLIIDRACVWSGSFNFSASAEARNAEHLFCIIDENTTAFLIADWQAHWTHATPLTTTANTTAPSASVTARPGGITVAPGVAPATTPKQPAAGPPCRTCNQTMPPSRFLLQPRSRRL
jgi:phosphatidylserine/phosphatidylglycerophosphate/cardiolipin synthase-like enzyme